MQKIRPLSILIAIFILPVGVYLVTHRQQFFNRAFGTFANIYVNAGNVVGGKKEVWRNLAQGGEEKGRQLLPVIDKIKVLQPKYIRIDHVFDYYTREELDLVIKDILATGAKPFISLSYMPPAISKTGGITDLPSDWQAWENLVTETIEHISGRSGLGIQDVYYEVWNEPDLFGGLR